MNWHRFLRAINLVLRLAPLIFLVLVLVSFGSLSARFLTLDNLKGTLMQASSLIIVAAGMNFVLLTAGVDLSVGATMYLAAVIISIAMPEAPAWRCLVCAVAIGLIVGSANGVLITALRLPPFIVTLAMTFVARGIGLYISATKMVPAPTAVTALGRGNLAGTPLTFCLAIVAVVLSWLILKATPFGPYVRSIGSDSEGAQRAGVPRAKVNWSVYVICGTFAGLGGFVSLSQASAATSAFGQGFEFMAIAAAVLGGTSLFGGRGSVWAPVIGAVLIMTVQAGLVQVNANPYSYPVITGAVIFLAALLDSVRSRLLIRELRRPIYVDLPIRRSLPQRDTHVRGSVGF